jgi:asparagine N-glycosylation enzyme membrane subunit Stt3
MLDFDNFQATMSRDSVIKFFAADRDKYTDLSITMYDYVPVISADKKTEWVTFWYKQSWKDAKGVADSMNVVDDVRLEKGKMVELSEKTSHYQKK